MDFRNIPLRFRSENLPYSHAQPEHSPATAQGFSAWQNPSPSSQTPSFLRTRCTFLEEELRTYMRRFREEQASKEVAMENMSRLQEERMQLEDDLNQFAAANSELGRENEALKESILEQEHTIAGMRNAHQHELVEAEEELTLLKSKYNGLVTEESLLRGDKYALDDLYFKEVKRRKDSQTEVARLEENLAELLSEVHEAAKKAEKETTRALRLQDQIKDLERDQAFKEPLVEIGVAIRTRFLQQARKMVMGHPTSIEAVRCGNAAAHRAQGFVDAAVFRTAHLVGRDRQEMVQVFKNLYKELPLQYGYGSHPKKYLEAIDCEATIRTTVSLKRQLSSMPQRLQAMDQIEAIASKLLRNGGRLNADEFERDADVEWRLQRVKVLTDEIVEAARSMK